jgi:serine/threonine protein kinase
LQYFNFRNSSNIDFNFPIKQGLGISKFLSHVSTECQDLILKLLCYNPEERYSAKQALNHPYFKDLVEQEQKLAKLSTNQFKYLNIFIQSCQFYEELSQRKPKFY